MHATRSGEKEFHGILEKGKKLRATYLYQPFLENIVPRIAHGLLHHGTIRRTRRTWKLQSNVLVVDRNG